MLIDLHTPLSKAECEKRLRERIHGPLETFTSVYGRSAATKFWIEQRTGYRNAFKTRLCGEVVERRGETVICCRVGMTPFVLAIVAGLFAIVAAAMALMWLTHGKVPLALPIKLAVGAALIAFGRFLARGEEETLLRFVRSTLEAGQQGAGMPAPLAASNS